MIPNLTQQEIVIPVGCHRRDTAGRGFRMLVSPEDAEFMASVRWSYMNGYALRAQRIGDRKVGLMAHRAVLSRKLGRPLRPDELTDHINGNRLDNRRENLRVVSTLGNSQHRAALHRNNKSGYRGVSWSRTRRRWVAQVSLLGKRYSREFTDLHEAGAFAEQLRKSLGFVGHPDTSAFDAAHQSAKE